MESEKQQKPGHVTQILDSISDDKAATEELLKLLYDELRSLAAKKLQKEPAGHTLQPTELVHEAFLRLIGEKTEIEWKNRGHFFSAAATAMQRILIESARRKKTVKHGGHHGRIDLDVAQIVGLKNDQEFLELAEALELLEQQDAELAQVVKLRFFAGLTVDETASILEMAPRTIDKRWQYARAWLFSKISRDRG